MGGPVEGTNAFVKNVNFRSNARFLPGISVHAPFLLSLLFVRARDKTCSSYQTCSLAEISYS